MVHVLHLPIFPEGSRISPDAINPFLLDDATHHEVAHIVINTADPADARRWSHYFVEMNKIPLDDVGLAAVDISKLEIGVNMMPVPPIPGSDIQIQAYYMPRKRHQQVIISLFPE